MSLLNDLIARVHASIDAKRLLRTGGRYVIALSGGADSTFLAYALGRLQTGRRLFLVAASLDHGLRETGRADQELVRRQARMLDIPFHGGGVSPSFWRDDRNKSPETAARRLRHRFLQSVKAAYRADGIVTGHNRTDHVETVLMNIDRGTGMRGVTGLLGSDIIRPLLDISRSEIRVALRRSGIPYREDPSNTDSGMLRNRVRLTLLEPLTSVFGEKNESAWLTLSGNMRDSMLALSTLLEDRFGPDIQCGATGVRLLRRSFPHEPEGLQQELVLWLIERVCGTTYRMNRDLVKQTVRFLQKEGYGRFCPFRDDTLAIVRSGRWITFLTGDVSDAVMDIHGPGLFPLQFGRLFVGGRYEPEDDRPHVQVDPVQYPFPWRLEPLSPGDTLAAGQPGADIMAYLKNNGVGAYERRVEAVLKCGKTVLLVPELAGRMSLMPEPGPDSIPVYMDRPMGYNPTRLQKADPIGSDHPKEAEEH